VLDGIRLERRGTPAAVVLTDRFEANGRQMQAIHGAAAFRWAITPHPIASRTDEELAAAARELLPETLERLLAG
jgi:hypothetical protein